VLRDASELLAVHVHEVQFVRIGSEARAFAVDDVVGEGARLGRVRVLRPELPPQPVAQEAQREEEHAQVGERLGEQVDLRHHVLLRRLRR
jgi:hypothetical protein